MQELRELGELYRSSVKREASNCCLSFSSGLASGMGVSGWAIFNSAASASRSFSTLTRLAKLHLPQLSQRSNFPAKLTLKPHQ